MSKATFVGKDFKHLISAVTQFSNVGSFGGSDMINLRVQDGWARAATSGIVLSKSRVKAQGELPLVALEARMLQPFATICPDDHTFSIEATDVLRLKHRREEIAPLAKGSAYQSVKDEELSRATLFEVTKELAAKISYLSAVAFTDPSRPDLNCVMLTEKGSAIACSQRVVTELSLKDFTVKNRVAVPTQMVSILENGDKFWAGETWTVLKRKNSRYEIPSPIRAQKEFPLESIRAYSQVKRKKVCTISGEALSAVIQDCNTCLSQLSKLDFKIQLIGQHGKINLSSEKGGAKFRSILKGSIIEDFDLVLPMDELLRVNSLVAGEKHVEVSIGLQNQETFLTFEDGWAMLPRLKK